MTIANFHQDVNDPENIEAEELVYQYLINQADIEGVTDWRDRHLAWDFTFSRGGKVITLDVKRDRNIGRTGNFPFEMCNLPVNGERVLTWGMNPELDYLAVVDASLTLAHIAHLPSLRQFVFSKFSPAWPKFGAMNRGYITIGIAVPMGEMRQANILMWDVVLPSREEAA